MSTFEEHFQRILDDRRSGSSTLTSRLIKLLKNNLGDRRILPGQARVRGLLESAVGAFPAMALLFNLRERSMRVLRQRRDDWREALANELGHFQQTMISSGELAARHFAHEARAERLFLTISSSRAVVSALQALSNHCQLRVIVCESRPVREGEAMARTLSRHGIQTEVVTDAAGGGLVAIVDAVIMGADWLHPSGFVNKTGSRMLSDLAYLYEKDTYVIGSKLRFNRKKPPIRPLRRHQALGLASSGDFEWVKWSAIHRLVTEGGATLPAGPS